MAGNKTDAHALAVLDDYLGTTHYLALHTADPGNAGSMANECSLGGYARQAITFGAAAIVADKAQTSNTNLIQFPVVTSGSETITHWTLMTAASGGTPRYKGSFAVSKAYTVDDRPEVPIGDVVVKER